MTARLPASEVIALVADEDTFTPWDDDVVSTDPLEFSDTMAYRERLRLTTERSGATESITAGSARINGHDVVLVVGDFSFLAGTLGVATAERVVRAFERARDLRVPVIALPISGGTRMQEGTAAFIQMASCAAAVQRFRDAGLLYVVYLRNPTTGGVLASWASLAHVRLAEPGALIGLTGPRVAKVMTGEAFPEGVQVAENLAQHGLIDDVVPAAKLRERLSHLLEWTIPAQLPWRPATASPPAAADAPVAWEAVTRSRRADRFDVTDVLGACDAELFRLRGDGAGSDEPDCFVGLARVCGIASVVLFQHRDNQAGSRGAHIGAAGYRQYRRGMLLADELRLPLVTFIDTQGAAVSVADEQSGLAAMIAECLATMSVVRTPTLSVLLGEGTGGGAIALLPADRVVAAEHSWLSPIAPEGASAILYRTADRAPEVAAAQAVTAADLQRLGIVDVVVPDAAPDPAPRLAAVIGEQLCALVEQDPEHRLAARERRYRTVAR